MKHLLNILDLSTKELLDLIKVSKDIELHPTKYQNKCAHKQLATLFFEPSTRTRLSFESAMLSLGGQVLGFSNAQNSSTAKGESVRDTIKVVSGYVDIIAMRHPKEGAPYVGLETTMVPLINAGDGGHFHPTQTLADLATIYNEVGRLDNLVIGICGDLKYGRTVHSLIGAMSRYKNIKFVLISPKELKIPEFVKKEILDEKHIPYEEVTSLEKSISKLDVLYMTRIQKERFLNQKEYEKLKDSYVLDVEKMKHAKKTMKILHPLPRVNEISVDVDKDSRACYFKQTEYGKYMRMALILKLLDEQNKPSNILAKQTYLSKKKCLNPHCISLTEQELAPKVYKDEYGVVRCAYCDAEI